MTLSYSLGFNPKWYFVDNFGKPLGAGQMFTYRSLDKTQKKFVYQDPGGNFPYTDPLLIDENGTAGPIYFQVDSTDPQETYYIEVYDRNGVLQWTMDFYLPNGSGGGGSDITTAINTENQIINGEFWRNIGQSANPVPSVLTIAPSLHDGFGGTTRPDITFVKSNMSATDQLTFNQFILGSNPLTGDISTEFYLNYTCFNAGIGGETFKYIQIPLCSHLRNLENASVGVSIWAKCNSGNNILNLSFIENYGEGTASSGLVYNPIQTITLTNTLTRYLIPTTTPNPSGTIGQAGNDALYLAIQYPLSVTTSIDIVKPSMYLGNLLPNADFTNNDRINAIISSPRTGDVRVTLNPVLFGWVIMNDGTIGNLGSNATTRANIDTYPLFYQIWVLFQSTQNFAPMFTSGGAPVTYGADPSLDFQNGNQISLTKAAGRMLAGIGTPSINSDTIPNGSNTGINWAIGQTTGYELHTQLETELATHHHPGSILVGALTPRGVAAPTQNVFTTAGATSFANISITPDGSSVPMNIQVPVTYMNVFMKL